MKGFLDIDSREVYKPSPAHSEVQHGAFQNRRRHCCGAPSQHQRLQQKPTTAELNMSCWHLVFNWQHRDVVRLYASLPGLNLRAVRLPGNRRGAYAEYALSTILHRMSKRQRRDLAQYQRQDLHEQSQSRAYPVSPGARGRRGIAVHLRDRSALAKQYGRVRRVSPNLSIAFGIRV